MRTRNSDASKSTASKKTPLPKKDGSGAGNTPGAASGKATPRSVKAGRGGANASKQSTPKSAATPKTPEPNVVEEPGAASEEKKPVAAAKVSVKKTEKGKSPMLASVKAAAKKPATMEETEVKVQKEEMNVGLEEFKLEAEGRKVEVKVEEVEIEPKVQEGLVVEEDEYEDVMEVQEPNVTSDQKGKMVDGLVREDNVSKENSNVPEGRDGDMAYKGQDNFQENVNEGFLEGEELGRGEEGAGEGPVELEEEVQNEISDMAKRRKLKKEQEIFVGGLERDAVEEDVRKAFETIGEVVEVRLHKDFVTSKNKGFAFVKFANKEQASKALAELKNPVIRGKRCGIAPSEDNDTLFLGNICNTWTKEAVKRKLQEYGVDGVEHITLVEDTQNEGLSRGFAFIEFACHADAMLGYKRLQKPDVIFGHPERTAKVAFAEPLREPDAEIMAQVKSVFVDGLPPYWDEDRVKQQFKEYGEIERVVLARNMSSAKRKDFGFVNFTTHESAVACIGGVNNTELGDGKSKMKVRARLANPLPKTQAVKGGMSGGFRIGQFSAGNYSGVGRGFGRGRFFHGRVGFLRGQGFHSRGRGRSGGFLFPDNNLGAPLPEFYGQHQFRGWGVRRGSYRNTYEGSIEEFTPRFSGGRRDAFNRGRGYSFQQRRQPFPLEGDFGGPSDGMQFDDPYFYGDHGPSIKRPFSMMDHDPGYLESVSRQRPRYDFADPLPGGARYRDALGPTGGPYSDYYGSDLNSGEYSSFHGGQWPGSGYYY